MRAYIKIFFVCLIINAGGIFAADANKPISSQKGYILGKDTLKKPKDVNQPVPNDRIREKMKEMEAMEKRIMEDVLSRKEERRIRQALGEAVISWLADANEAAGNECDRLADSLLSIKEPKPSVRAYFIAAQVAKLRGKHLKAIAILEEVINKHPDESAEVSTFPVRIVGRFWIGTIARQSGDIMKTKNVYEAILKDLENMSGLEGREGLIMICNLYLAETESEHLKNNSNALARFEAIERIKRPEGQWGIQYDMFKDWSVYQRDKISKGKKQAAQRLATNLEIIETAPLLAANVMNFCGMTGEPLVSCCGGPGERSLMVLKTFIKQASESKTSKIDRDLAKLTYGVIKHPGQEERQRQEEKETEKHYSTLFDEDSYFSPMAGIYLASCKIEQGNIAEGNAILDKVKSKYPGYEPAVNKLKRPQK
jgi:tetratricopeptide (TPR) repeat protein